jgi:predicted ATPase
MRILSFHQQGIYGLPEIALDFVDHATGKPRQRTVIAGSNGTGKTTVLEMIYSLLKLIPHLYDAVYTSKHALAQNAKVEITLGNLPLPSSEYPVTLSLTANGPHLAFSEVRGNTGGNWIGAIREALAGKRDFPNCVYFPSEGRELQSKTKGQIIDEPRDYQWVYRFDDSTKWEGSLESFLVAMDYRDLMAQREGRAGDEFSRFTKLINGFLQDKQIRGVDDKFRIRVEAANGQQFGLEALSSGEKQIVLLLGEIQRRLRPGGLLLIDEPEIHLHPRWQRLLVRALTDLCVDYDAQMILTTHSEEIASAVYEHELVLLDAIFVRETAV